MITPLHRNRQHKPSEADFIGFLSVVRQARKRAGFRGSEYSLTDDDAKALWARCGGCCELTKLPFDFTALEQKFQRRPYAPSLDRRDNAIGYTMENVRVVCVAVNLAMNAWGESVLLRIAAGLFETGAFGKIARREHSPVVLPEDVRMYMGKKQVKYLGRVRDFGIEIHLGAFATIAEALEARLAWARANRSLKVIRQIFAYTKDDNLLNEINNLRESLLVGGEGFENVPPGALRTPPAPFTGLRPL